MKKNSLFLVGGMFAILIGLIKIWSGVGYLILLPDLRATVPGPKFLPAYAASPVMLNLIFWGEALVGILGLAVVPALSRVVRDKEEGWVTWTSNLATVGFSLRSLPATQ
jgi:hypothetical protein